MNKKTYITLLTLAILATSTSGLSVSAKEEETTPREILLSNTNSIMLTKDYATDKGKLEELIKNKRPRNLYVEHWVVQESTDKNLLKNIRKITNKYNTRLYFVTGRNSWIGPRALENIKPLYDEYGQYVDGIVLRIEPNRLNVWKETDDTLKAQVLNQMLDSYSQVYSYAKSINKNFLVEIPFWLTDYAGPKRSFSDDACIYSDKIVFLIDDETKLDSINMQWNDITCGYTINLGKRATRQSEEKIKEIYDKLNKKLVLYSNFGGYIIDSDSTIDNKASEKSSI